MNSVEERLKALEDERQIRALVACFADVCTSGDTKRFAALWTEEGVWYLGAPFSYMSKGRANNTVLFTQLADGKRFFCQMIHSGVVLLTGETATARWILSERSVDDNGSVYQSLATYDDQFTYEAGEWLFLERSCTFLDIFPRNDVEL